MDFKALIRLYLQKYNTNTTSKMTLLGLYLHYLAVYGRFTDFRVLQQGIWVTIFFVDIFLAGFLSNEFSVSTFGWAGVGIGVGDGGGGRRG